MTFDHETGEVQEPISTRAVNGAAKARIEMEHTRTAFGNSPLHGAIARALRKIPIFIATDAKGAHKINYATLLAILDVVRPPLEEQGIRIRQGTERSYSIDDGGGMKGRIIPVYTDLVHCDTGTYERTMIEIPILKMDPQAVGSAVQYGKRYTLLAGLGLATGEADDDGEAAKVREIGQKAPDGNDLAVLKSEMDAIANEEKTDNAKKLEKLSKWAADPKIKARLNRLNDAESDRAITYYGDLRAKFEG